MGKTKDTGAVAANTPVVQYAVQPPKRPLTGTKWGAQGNAGTHAALFAAAQANGGTLTYAQVHATCVGLQHAGFARYAVRRGWVTPVTA
jgi:hypothetical protein